MPENIKNIKEKLSKIADYLTPKPPANIIEDIIVIEVQEEINIIPKIEKTTEIIIDEKCIGNMKTNTPKEKKIFII